MLRLLSSYSQKARDLMVLSHFPLYKRHHADYFRHFYSHKCYKKHLLMSQTWIYLISVIPLSHNQLNPV